MTNHLLTRLPANTPPVAPTPNDPPRGFLDCRGEWQPLDRDEEHDAAS